MPDFTLTGPEGQSFQLTGPEGATLEDATAIAAEHLSMTHEAPQRTGAQAVLEGGLPEAARTTGAAIPPGLTKALEQGVKIPGAGGLSDFFPSLQTPVGKALQSEPAQTALGVMDAPGRGGRPPQPTRPSFDTYVRALTGHSAEAMSAETRAGFAERYAQRYGQQAPAGPAAAPGRSEPMPIRDFSVQRTGFTPDQLTDAQVRQLHREYNAYRLEGLLQQPGRGTTPGRPVSAPPAAQQGLAAPAIVRPTSNDIFQHATQPRLAREVWDQHFAQHFPDQQKFVQDYFAGLVRPGEAKVNYTSGGVGSKSQGLEIGGTLYSPDGTGVGHVTRQFYPNAKEVHHDMLSLNDESQAAGIVKQLQAGNMAAYEKMGIEHIDMLANLGIGGYAWAKYGYLPQNKMWRADVGKRLDYLEKRGLIEPDVANDYVRPLLKNAKRDDIWELSDFGHPFDGAAAGSFKAPGVYIPIKMDHRTNTVGKGLLIGQSWKADFNLPNNQQMTRFNIYVGRQPSGQQ